MLRGVYRDVKKSLRKAGFAWQEPGENESEMIFVIGVLSEGVDDECGLAHVGFKLALIDKNINIETELAWADLSRVALDGGVDFYCWRQQALPLKLYDLMRYYDDASVFGEYMSECTYSLDEVLYGIFGEDEQMPCHLLVR